jgi:two-component system, OmpR family, response regulator
VVVLAGGNRERGLRLSEKLAIEQYDVILCQSSKEFCATINEDGIAAILFLFPDEVGVIDVLFEEGIISCVGDNVPRLFISTSPVENNKVRSYNYKADEFLIEPVSTDEIIKIINDSIVSRLKNERRHILEIGDLLLNTETLIVTWRNKRLPLYPLQVHLLQFLMMNPRRPITRMELLNTVWIKNASIDDRTINRNVKRIRDVFRRETKLDPIQTVRRVGYSFNDQFEQLSALSGKSHR